MMDGWMDDDSDDHELMNLGVDLKLMSQVNKPGCALTALSVADVTGGSHAGACSQWGGLFRCVNETYPLVMTNIAIEHGYL